MAGVNGCPRHISKSNVPSLMQPRLSKLHASRLSATSSGDWLLEKRGLTLKVVASLATTLFFMLDARRPKGLEVLIIAKKGTTRRSSE